VFMLHNFAKCIVMNYSAVLVVQFSRPAFPGSESLGRVPVTLLLEGGTSDSNISVTVTPSDQSPLSAEGKRCVS